jgi:Protein of unknown function (DUF4089)
MDEQPIDWSVSLDQMAIAVGLSITPTCRPGVLANLERTAAIAQRVMDFPLPTSIEIAPTFDPGVQK